jgi:diaminohydroxyphosphoribosylaminopyrimidine deaminase / 5-amino-6-(5-phosphoribosylamino)uracil reductase
MIGEGWHERAGEAHAEIHALQAALQAAEDRDQANQALAAGQAALPPIAVRGCTAYVSLEPCSHTGRTGPCCEALIEAGVGRVVVAMQDPNPLVSGQGIARLQQAGIAVTVGVMEAEARKLNPGFISRMTKGLPWIRMKIGMSLDGRTALGNGVSQWITSEESRADAHAYRARSCAVMTGIGTLLADDPALTVRHIPCERQPVRVLIDALCEAPLTAKLFAEGHAIVMTLESTLTGGDASSEGKIRAEALRAQGVTVLGVPAAQGKSDHLDLVSAMKQLAERGINEVLVEAGANLNAELFKAGLVDECVFYISPQLLGMGAQGPASLGPLVELSKSFALQFSQIDQIGPDLRVTAVPKNKLNTLS